VPDGVKVLFLSAPPPPTLRPLSTSLGKSRPWIQCDNYDIASDETILNGESIKK